MVWEASHNFVGDTRKLVVINDSNGPQRQRWLSTNFPTRLGLVSTEGITTT